MKKKIKRRPKLSAKEKLLLKAFIVASKVVNDSAKDPGSPNNEKIKLLDAALYSEFKLSIHDVLYEVLVGSNTRATSSHLMSILGSYYDGNIEAEGCLKMLIKWGVKVKPIAFRMPKALKGIKWP